MKEPPPQYGAGVVPSGARVGIATPVLWSTRKGAVGGGSGFNPGGRGKGGTSRNHWYGWPAPSVETACVFVNMRSLGAGAAHLHLQPHPLLRPQFAGQGSSTAASLCSASSVAGKVLCWSRQSQEHSLFVGACSDAATRRGNSAAHTIMPRHLAGNTISGAATLATC